MSGGHFNYDQYKIRVIADSIDQIIRKNNVKREKQNSWDPDYHYQYSDEVIAHFKEAWYQIRKAEIFAQRVDWLVSGDDGEKSFLKRLYEDIERLEEEKLSNTFEFIPDED
jgi:hypothetical protein